MVTKATLTDHSGQILQCQQGCALCANQETQVVAQNVNINVFAFNFGRY
jgi:hypothetical protein